ncbi:hypothetical protein, partial [Micromonospora parva]|uniref:hypothetical protein n=1 Tax=Micromonospora parva TaxID=1464048 RepID=UPI00365D5499
AELAFVAVAATRSLLIDAGGVMLGLETGDVQFAWAEIHTVGFAPEGPKHLRVTVHLHNGAAPQILLAARRRAQLREWLEDLPLILECFT